jgi:hypothetical protein
VCCSKKYFSLLLNSCILSNCFIVLGNLLYNFIPTFVLLFLRSVVLQNLVWRSNFWRVQWSCTSPLYLIFSIIATGTKRFDVVRVIKQLLNHFLQILIKQKQWQTSLLFFREKIFQVACVTTQLAHIFSITMQEIFFQIQRCLWTTFKICVHL